MKPLLSSRQDRSQNEESGSYAVSSPSPRDEGVGTKHQIPNTKLQRNPKLQIPKPVAGSPPWSLRLGASLVFGVWCLVFRSLTSRLLMAVLILSGAVTRGSSQSPDHGPVSKEVLLRQTVENVIRPAYIGLQSACREFEQAAAELSATPSSAALKKAQDTWVAAMVAARRVQAYKVGPLTDRECVSTFYYWQILPVRVEALLASPRALDDSCLDELGATTKGLFALEYLLFERASVSPAEGANATAREPGILSGTNTARRCQFVSALARDLGNKAGKLAGDWSDTGEQGASLKFANGGQESVNLLVNQISMDLENIAEEHVNLVLQLPNPIARQIHRIECARSGTSLRALEARLVGLHELYHGGAGLGIDDYLRGLNSALETRVEQQFQRAISRLQALGAPLEQAATTNRGSLEAAYQAIRDLELLFKVDLASALGVTITFNSNDGD